MITLEGFPSRILIVDDKPRVREALAERIAATSDLYHPQVAASGEQALELLASSHFDMVLCDLRLKGEMSGLELTRETTRRNPKVKVVVFSGKDVRGSEKNELLEAGALFYLSKPIDFGELLNAIEKINAIRRTERQSQWFEQLARISYRLQSSFDPEVLAQRIVEGACELGYHRARLYRHDPERATLVGQAACGMEDNSKIKGYEIPFAAAPVIQQIFAHDRPTVWNRQIIEERFGSRPAERWMEDFHLKGVAWIDCPLVVGNRRIGTLSVDHHDPETVEEGPENAIHFSKDDRRILGIFSGLAAQALRNSSLYRKEALARASLESILRDAPDAVITTDLSGTIDFVSPSSERVLGRTPDTMLKRPAAEFYADENGNGEAGPEVARDIMRRLYNEGPLANFRIFLHGDVPPRPISLSVSLLRDEEGEPIGTLGFLKDLGHLEEQTRQYRDVLQGFGYGTLMLTPTGSIGFVNRKAERLLALDREELIGRDLADLLRPAQRDELHRGIADVTQKGCEVQLDLSVAQPGGRRLPIQAILTPARLGQGKPGIAVGLQDKSEVESLVQSGRLMALGQMVAGVGHEINNPVNHILLAVRELEEELHLDPESESHQLLDIILRNGQRIRDLVKQLRETARPGELRPGPLFVEDLVKRSMAFFAQRFKKRGITFSIEIEPNLPAVYGDASRLQQVLINLLINAEEAMEDEGAAKTIHLTAHREDAGVSLNVCDTGSGVPEGIRDRIFDPFYTTKAPNRGTGLGLSISRSIVESHGGSLRVTASEQGRGACFRMTLPLAEE